MIYPENFEEKVGFDRIRELLEGYCLGEAARARIQDMVFMTDREAIHRETETVHELQQFLSGDKIFPLDHYHDLGLVFRRMSIEGTHIEPDELVLLRDSLGTLRTLVRLFTGPDSEKYPRLSTLAEPVKIHPFITESIDKILSPKGEIRDRASQDLHRIRQDLSSRKEQVNIRIHQLLKQLQSAGTVEKDSALTVRNGRLVIPVPAGNKRKISGLVHDESATGKTVFMEPSEVVDLNNQILELEYAEKREILRILKKFTDSLRPYLPELEEAYSFLAYTDFTRARVQLAVAIHALKPQSLPGAGIVWDTAVHPLLYLNFRKEGKKVVPLDISLDEKKRILVISGPNAGGKSVCLKTVGLIQYMWQCGLLVPVKESSKMGTFSRLFIDMGDDQSIENDLSTYSSHLFHMKYMLRNADPDSLVLIDEFGSGTEPQLGGAIAEAILARLCESACYGLITTHYSNLKHFAASAEGIQNAAMLFDTGMMQPLFRLEMGKPGSSFAFEIARKIGLPEDLLKNASEKVGKGHVEFDRHLKDLARDKSYIERKRIRIRQVEKELDNTLEKYARELEAAEAKRKEILEEARRKAEEMLNGVNRTIENTIRVIRETQAEKEKTREARKKLESLRRNLDQEPGKDDAGLADKMTRVERQRQKLKSTGTGEGEPPAKKPGRKTALEPGDYVRMEGQEAVGQVISLSGKSVMVSFGQMISSLDPRRLEKLDPEEVRQLDTRTRKSGFGYDLMEKKMHFKTEIDIRGARAEEAIRRVSDYLDDAVMVGSGEVRILHGKGDGILRQVIREYLSALNIVRSYHDEHPERGGSGITVVELEG